MIAICYLLFAICQKPKAKSQKPKAKSQKPKANRQSNFQHNDEVDKMEFVKKIANDRIRGANAETDAMNGITEAANYREAGVYYLALTNEFQIMKEDNQSIPDAPLRSETGSSLRYDNQSIGLPFFYFFRTLGCLS